MKSKGTSRTNYWMQQVRYTSRSSAQSFLGNEKSSNLKSNVMAASDCSCNCYGGCSGGSCSSCSYGNS